jgi:hypothetical protein
MNLLRNFDVRELVPQSVYETEREAAIRHVTPALQLAVEDVRALLTSHYTGRVVMLVNTWMWGGRFRYRGYRNPQCGVGAKGGEHYRGTAADFDVYVERRRVDPETVRRLIAEHRDQVPTITRIERGVNWVHIDCKPAPIVYFNP